MLSLILYEYKPKIAFEEPGYLGARAVFTNYNYELIPIRPEEDGINVNELRKSEANVVYVTPSHQYPYGMVMSISKRINLLNWAKENQGIIIEDDYDGEFRYRGKPIPPLQGLDDSGRVVYLGSFSKSFMPSMRISYMVLPRALFLIYEKKCKIYEQSIPRFMQKALEIFMKEGYWDKFY